jgi:hypothetical protein
MIKEIIEQIRDQQALTKKEIIPDKRTLSTQLGNIKRAEETLNHLFIDLRDAVKQNIVLILVGGKHSKDFAEIAAENFACITFKAEGVFEEIAGYVDDNFLGKPASPTIFDIAMGAMSDMSHDIGILGYNYVQFKSEDAGQLKTREDLVNLIANAFNREIGAELVALKAIHDTAVKIMESDFEGKRVPVIMYSENKKLLNKIGEDSKRVINKVFAVSASKKSTKESVENKLVELSKQAQEA